MSGQNEEGKVQYTEPSTILGEYCRILGAIDAIEVMAMYDHYLPVERVLKVLGRAEAAEIIEKKKENGR